MYISVILCSSGSRVFYKLRLMSELKRTCIRIEIISEIINSVLLFGVCIIL